MQANSELNYQGCDGNEGPFSGERRSVEVVLVTQKLLSHTGNGTETHIPYGRWQTMSQGPNVALWLFVWPVAKAWLYTFKWLGGRGMKRRISHDTWKLCEIQTSGGIKFYWNKSTLTPIGRKPRVVFSCFPTTAAELNRPDRDHTRHSPPFALLLGSAPYELQWHSF